MTRKPFSLVRDMRIRNVVVHHTHILDRMIVRLLRPGDLVFFDDCVYSQYAFFMENLDFFNENDIYMVFGFSTALYRDEDAVPITETTAELHRRFHSGDLSAKDGFMSLSELRKVLDFDKCYLACHGGMHLELDDENGYVEFRKDVEEAERNLSSMNLRTNIFVYPYDRSFRFSDGFLKSHGFNFIYPSDGRRTYIEDLANAAV